LDGDDPWNDVSRRLFEINREDLIIPGLVLAELDYWCQKRGLAQVWEKWLEELNDGAGFVDWPTSVDLTRALELQQMYAGVGIVDATILALVERWNEDKIASLDHRHFGMMRPGHVETLRLLPS
jgi:uncharacterized protein